jgi:hypothetical protein
MSVFRRLGDKYNIDSQDVQEAIKEELNPEKNKTFSWGDFLGNVKEVIPNPLNPFDTTTGRIRQQLEQKLIEEGKLHEQDADSWIDEVRKGINIGEARIAYSFADLLFGGLDLTFDTDTLSKVDEIFNNYKPEEPEGALGDLTSLLVEYGVPGSMLLKITSRAKKLLPGKKINKLFIKE